MTRHECCAGEIKHETPIHFRVEGEVEVYYYEDPDGNFVEQFQGTGFDARLWELYLFAALTELGYTFDRAHAAPDFLCAGILGQFFVQAVTVNPTMANGLSIEAGPPEDEEGRRRYVAEYMPIKFGSALYSKLQKRYWEQTHVANKPIPFAIQDFHFPRSMTWSEPSLAPYLYARQYSALYDEAGALIISMHNVLEHRWETKSSHRVFSISQVPKISALLLPTHREPLRSSIAWVSKQNSDRSLFG